MMILVKEEVLSNSQAHKERQRQRAKVKAKESNMKRPKRQSVEERKLNRKLGG